MYAVYAVYAVSPHVCDRVRTLKHAPIMHNRHGGIQITVE